jgi:hypothetical protein
MCKLEDFELELDEVVISEDVTNDKTQVALSLEGNDHVANLVDNYRWFKDGLDAYRTGVALALARNKSEIDLPPVTNKKTKYSVSSLDPDGRLRDLIVTFRPELEHKPYAASEWLAEIGLSIIREELDSGKLLSEILLGTETSEGENN